MSDEERRHRGTVKWFDDDKGWGFIRVGNKDLFVHFSQIKMDGHKTLNPGQEVSFVIGQGPQGQQQAHDVVVLAAVA